MGLLLAVLCAIDFQRHFYTSKKAVDAERAAIRRDIEVLRKSPDDTRTYDDLLVRSERLLAYLYLQYSIDTTNIAARDDEEALSVEVAEITRRVSLPNVPWQKKSRDEMAAELIALTNSGNEYARAHGYADAAEAAYAQNGWTKSDVETLLARVERYRPQYEEYRSTRKKLEPPRQFSVDDARETILTSIHALPAAFRVEMRRLLDPEEQRIDMAPGPNRKRGAYSKGFPGTTSVVFMSGFTGTYNDMRALMHEGTHAVHRQLQARGRVRPRYANGPKWILEATAVFAEMLLADTLARKTGEPFYAQQFLEGKAFSTIFVTADEARVEQQIYDGVASGKIRNADDLDAVSNRWMDIPLMYEDPFYDVNYTWAGVVGLTLYSRFLQHPEQAGAKYVALMEHEFDRPVDRLLRETLQINIHDPQLVDEALKLPLQKKKALENSR